jgi:glycosyltransferase involved in cell wall biosynthesis
MNKISILTPTQLSRKKNLVQLVKQIHSQTYYSHIVQWVIVNGSPTYEEADAFSGTLLSIQREHPELNVTIIDWKERTFADLFNDGNAQCTGDYIAIMEDDEYYFPTHLSHAVNQLSQSAKQIAGCSSVFMYVRNTNTAYQWTTTNANHSCNHALVYKRTYLDTHSFTHNPECKTGVEASFTNQWSEPMIQLDPNKCVVHIFHDNNTFLMWSSLLPIWIARQQLVPVESKPYWVEYI